MGNNKSSPPYKRGVPAASAFNKKAPLLTKEGAFLAYLLSRATFPLRFPGTPFTTATIWRSFGITSRMNPLTWSISTRLLIPTAITTFFSRTNPVPRPGSGLF